MFNTFLKFLIKQLIFSSPVVRAERDRTDEWWSRRVTDTGRSRFLMSTQYTVVLDYSRDGQPPTKWKIISLWCFLSPAARCSEI